MNRILSVVYILAIGAIGAWAQGGAQASSATLDSLLDPLTEDISALVGGIGPDIAPELLQAALSGDIVGEAAFAGDFPHGRVTFPALGLNYQQIEPREERF